MLALPERVRVRGEEEGERSREERRGEEWEERKEKTGQDKQNWLTCLSLSLISLLEDTERKKLQKEATMIFLSSFSPSLTLTNWKGGLVRNIDGFRQCAIKVLRKKSREENKVPKVRRTYAVAREGKSQTGGTVYEKKGRKESEATSQARTHTTMTWRFCVPSSCSFSSLCAKVDLQHHIHAHPRSPHV